MLYYVQLKPFLFKKYLSPREIIIMRLPAILSHGRVVLEMVRGGESCPVVIHHGELVLPQVGGG